MYLSSTYFKYREYKALIRIHSFIHSQLEILKQELHFPSLLVKTHTNILARSYPKSHLFIPLGAVRFRDIYLPTQNNS